MIAIRLGWFIWMSGFWLLIVGAASRLLFNSDVGLKDRVWDLLKSVVAAFLWPLMMCSCGGIWKLLDSLPFGIGKSFKHLFKKEKE